MKNISNESNKLKEYIKALIEENKRLDNCNNASKIINQNPKATSQDETIKEDDSVVCPPFYSNSSLDQYKISKENRTSSLKKNTKSDIFSKLHYDGYSKQEFLKINEELKAKRETENCTFHPLISSKSRVKNLNVYDRLSRTACEKELLRKEKEPLELQHCTFHPFLPRARRSNTTSGTIFDRLHAHADEKEKSRKYKELLFKDKDLDGCTFKPDVISKRSMSHYLKDDNSLFSKLYNDNVIIKNKKDKKEIEIEDNTLKHCTFNPMINACNEKVNNNNKNRNEGPCYDRLYQKRIEREKMIEKKRKEIEEEEKKMSLPIINKLKSSQDDIENIRNTEFIKDPFNRLYQRREEYQKNKRKLIEKVMIEEGCIFEPQINKNSSELTERLGMDFDQRNFELLNRKENRVNEQKYFEEKECSFKPSILNYEIPAKKENCPTNVVERLYSYIPTYEKNIEELRIKYKS